MNFDRISNFFKNNFFLKIPILKKYFKFEVSTIEKIPIKKDFREDLSQSIFEHLNKVPLHMLCFVSDEDVIMTKTNLASPKTQPFKKNEMCYFELVSLSIHNNELREITKEKINFDSL